MAMVRRYGFPARWLCGLAALSVVACAGLKSAPEDSDGGDAGELDAATLAEASTPTEASLDADAGARDGAVPDAAGAPTVELTMSAGCDQPWQNLVYQGPPLVAGSMSVVSATNNGRVTLVRRTAKSEVTLSSAADRAGGDILQIYSNGQLFVSSCNVGTGPCVYTPSPPSFANDPISGTVKVVRYDEATRGFEIELTGVVLQSGTTGTLCEVSGRVSAN